MAEPFVAEIRIWAISYAPRFWAFCNGNLLSIAQYSTAYALVGTTYGGNGTTTFGLPNLSVRAPLHVGGVSGQGPGLSHHYWGEMGGYLEVPLSSNQMPGHSHRYNVSEAPTYSEDPENNLLRTGKLFHAPCDPPAEMAPSENTGGGAGHENRQPYLGLQFLFALDGIWPARP